MVFLKFSLITEACYGYVKILQSAYKLIKFVCNMFRWWLTVKSTFINIFQTALLDNKIFAYVELQPAMPASLIKYLQIV